MQTQTNLDNQTVTVKIKNKSGYCADLYNAIQGKQGKVIRKYPDNIINLDGEKHLVEFDEQTTAEFKEKSGNWSADESKRMQWWVLRKNFVVKK